MNINKQIEETSWQSLLLPVVLMITGAILLAAVSFGAISLDRLTNFWPMGIILVGLVELVSPEETKQRASK
jgi:hypothetical protein